MTIFSSIKKHTTSLVVISALAMISFSSFASYTQVSALITGSNDCSGSGYFDAPNTNISGFSNCRIFVDNGGTPAYLADVIAKFDIVKDAGDNELPIIHASTAYTESAQYASLVTRNDWAFSNLVDEDKTGTWTYNGGVHKLPDIRFWSAKAGNAFRLFWLIEEEDGINDACISGNVSTTTDNLNFSCMDLAISVTTGDWTTPEGKGLSHITFFGGPCKGPECGPTTNTQVPEPASLALLALGLLGLGARRKQVIKTKNI